MICGIGFSHVELNTNSLRHTPPRKMAVLSKSIALSWVRLVPCDFTLVSLSIVGMNSFSLHVISQIAHLSSCSRVTLLMNGGLVAFPTYRTYVRLDVVRLSLFRTTIILRFLIAPLNVFSLGTPLTQSHTTATIVHLAKSLPRFMCCSLSRTNPPPSHVDATPFGQHSQIPHLTPTS